MSFDSLTYLLFLPVVALLHAALPHRFRWVLLLAASTVFYAIWNVPLTLLLFGVIAVTFAAGLLLDRIHSPRGRRAVLLTAIALCAGQLLYFKYASFLVQSVLSIARLLGAQTEWRLWDIVLPIGISFYTFQALSYVIDVYRGTIRAERHFGYYALYLSFFPQLVAGPIERADALLPQLKAERTVRREDVTAGCALLLAGLFRKVVIADFCGAVVTRVYDAPLPDGSAVWIATVLFGIQIYSDFAGYSEIARGSARLLGIHLMQNFDRPYAAPDIRAFWRRWHISLTKWLTDYIYIPLGGSQKGLWRQIAATMVVFAVSGLWHGANATFVVWGLLHGVCVCALLLLRRTGLRLPDTAPVRAVQTVLTFALVTWLWIFFRAQSLEAAWLLQTRLFAPWSLQAGWGALGIDWTDAIRIVLSLLTVPLLNRISRRPEAGAWAITCGYLVAAILMAWLIRLDQNAVSAFLYFQF